MFDIRYKSHHDVKNIIEKKNEKENSHSFYF